MCNLENIYVLYPILIHPYPILTPACCLESWRYIFIHVHLLEINQIKKVLKNIVIQVLC